VAIEGRGVGKDQMNYMLRKDEMGRKTTGIYDQKWRPVHDKTQFYPKKKSSYMLMRSSSMMSSPPGRAKGFVASTCDGPVSR